MLTVGKHAPPFSLPAHTGTSVALKDFRGSVVVLYFYPKDHTSGCTREACSFRDNWSRLKRKGAVVLGVSADSIASHTKFAGEHDLPFLLLSDERKEMVKRYGVWKKKSLYGRSYHGIERTTVIIDEKGTILHVFRKVKVEGHVDEIIAVLKHRKG